MNARPTVDALLQTARNSRESMGPDEDWAPIIIYTSKSGHEALGLLGADEDVPAQLVQSLIEMHRVMGPAEWIAFTGDTYATYVPLDEFESGAVNIEELHDILASEFKKGAPNVIEMMITMIVSHDGRASTAYQQYRYTPADGWEWEEPTYVNDAEDADAGHGGNIQSALMAFFVAQKMAGQ